MRFLKNKFLWLTVYAIVITGVFLYILFPSPLVLQCLKNAAFSSGWILEAGTLHPSLPLGMKLKDLTVSSVEKPADAIFHGRLLDLQFSPLSIFRERKTLNFSGKAYGGSFDGNAGFAWSNRRYAPAEGKINFQNIDLARCNSHAFTLLKGMTGQARGSAFYIRNDATNTPPAGKLSLHLQQGAYHLPESFLGFSRIEFDRGEIQAQLKNSVLKLEKFDIYGIQVNCFLNGDIQLADRMTESRLNLKGVLEIAGKNKIKMNITIGGTLASPSFRYI